MRKNIGLFRGKYAEQWLYGYLTINGNGSCQIWENTDMGIFPAIVDPKTVGEFTGLTDKNGVKIFEGDILSSDKYPYTSDGSQNYFAEVVWFDNCPAFGLYTFKAPKSVVRGVAEGSEFIEDDLSDMEVIGNIYDNPELMGGDDNVAD